MITGEPRERANIVCHSRRAHSKRDPPTNQHTEREILESFFLKKNCEKIDEEGEQKRSHLKEGTKNESPPLSHSPFAMLEDEAFFLFNY